MIDAKMPDWRGMTAVICATGPSFKPDGLVPHGTRKFIAVNNAWTVLPWANVLYACDYLWWRQHFDAARRVFAGQMWTQDRSAAERWPFLHHVKHQAGEGLGLKMLNTNGNSGMGAINLAYLFGARRILLVGFDMKLGPNGERHCHPDHPKPLVQNQTFDEWIHKGAKLARDLKTQGCTVLNCTPNSALTCFPMSTIEQELT